MGAPESNAGDDFHFWWAASRALALIEPGADLYLVTLEGLASVDDPEDAYETVDVGEYYGASDIAAARAVVLSQLKYSTRHPELAWTTARICQARARRRPDGSTTPARSVISDLADAFRRLVDDHGVEAAAKARIALVTNQPADALLEASVSAAADWIRARQEQPKKAALLAALPEDQRAVVQRLAEAVGSRLTSCQFCDFVARLDLSHTDALERSVLARAVHVRSEELTPGRGADSALRLFHLVRDEALPGPRQGVTATDVLAKLGAPELVDLYPAPPRPADVPEPLPAPAAKEIADAALSHLGSIVVAHGAAGAGKTTALRQVAEHLPAGSAFVLFDCYGGGEYLSSGEERHTPQRFVTQVINELAQLCGTPLLVQPPQLDPDLWRRFRLTLERAVDVLDPQSVLVIAVDAADNAIVAATQNGDRAFVPPLLHLQLPDRVAVVLTARTHRIPSLGADRAATIKIAPFDAATSAAHLRRHRPDATDAEAAQFHARTDGNPRAQFYALSEADARGADMTTLLERSYRTPDAIFDNLVDSALQISGADVGGQRWLALMLALARPVSIDILAAALEVTTDAVDAFAAGLAPGVRIADGAIQFRDEDFETHVRSRVEPGDVIVAHDRLANLFLESRIRDPDAAAHVADHLFSAGRFDDLLGLVLEEDTPVGIDDGFRREQVQGRRLDLAARAAAESGDPAAAVRIAARGCDTASRRDTLSRLVESHLDLVARYADIELLSFYALRQTNAKWLGPIFMRLAAALARDPERHDAARAALHSADAWLRRWAAEREDEAKHWRVEIEDVAASAEASYRLEGMPAAIDELQRWRPESFVWEAAAAAAARLAGDLVPEEAREALRASDVPAAAQAPVLAYACTSEVAPDPAWVNEVVAALPSVPAGEPRPWHLLLLNAAIRHGDRNATCALARHWSRELPSTRWEFVKADADAVLTLRCHAITAALEGTDLQVDALIPRSLRPPESVDSNTPGRSARDDRGHERSKWVEIVSPIAAAATLAARAAVHDASAEDVVTFCHTGLSERLQRADHRWFTYDPSFRAWSVLILEAALDLDVVADVLECLADAAMKLVRERAPALWLDLADTLERNSHHDPAIDLCLRAASHVRDNVYSASDRLDLLARAADLAARIAPPLGKQLFDWTVNAATGVNDDAARLLLAHADLASRANIPPQERAGVADRLVRSVEAVALHVTDSDVVPYEAIAAAATHLDAATGLAAVSRWDDEDRITLTWTLPNALTAAVDSGSVPARHALALDHLIEDDRRRLKYQLDIASRMSTTGPDGIAAARIAIARASNWIRRHVPARDQAELAKRLLDAATAQGLEGNVRSDLEQLIALARTDESPTTNRWREHDDQPPEVQGLLANPALRDWRTLAEDVDVLNAAFVYGHELRNFIRIVALATPIDQRVDALTAVAALPRRHSETALDVLAECLRQWRDWPGVAAWADAGLPPLLSDHLDRLAWYRDAAKLLQQLRTFGDDNAIRRAVLLALPEARPRLTASGWQNIAVVLGQLCGPESAAEAVIGLLRDRVDDASVTPADALGPLPLLLWSAFGHPRRGIRWRAAHATRELLANSHPIETNSLAAALVSCLDREDPDRFRDPSLHFYALSAAAALLVAFQRVALDHPAVIAPHFEALARHALSTELPHTQIRELSRLTAIAVADPADPNLERLHHANQPSCCHVDRGPGREREDRRVSDDRRYDFHSMDTLPYWYAPLARVFDVPVDTVAAHAERWILDRWGLGREDWMTDARELRDQRSYERMSHRHGSIPPEENLRLYLEYHAMLAAAGELADAGRPMKIDAWEADDPWRYWLARHLPLPGPWLADLAAPIPLEPQLFGHLPPLDERWDTVPEAEYDTALGLVDGALHDQVLIAASTSLYRTDGYESSHVWSALVAPDYAEDLQRALASAKNPTDWKLPDEGEDEFEVHTERFELRGWIADPRDYREGLDEHDPYAHGLRPSLPLPGRRFRDMSQTEPDGTALALVTSDGSVVARAEQWDDTAPARERDNVTSSGYRTRVDRGTLLGFLADTGMRLIVEVQIGRHRSDRQFDDYRPPQSRVYLIDADGRVTAG